MAAPTTTVRQAPVGIKMDDGHPTKIAFERDPDVSFWEKTTKPPGIDGGDAIKTTTMHNTEYHTKAPRSLKDMTDSELTVSYDPVVYPQIMALINKNGSITARFPEGSTLDFFGFLRTFEPSENTEGEPPEAKISITVTNYDPVNRVEAGPVLTNVAGT